MCFSALSSICEDSAAEFRAGESKHNLFSAHLRMAKWKVKKMVGLPHFQMPQKTTVADIINQDTLIYFVCHIACLANIRTLHSH